MRILIPVEEKMLSEAEFGYYDLHYIITKKKANELREQKFVVTDLHKTNRFPRLHKIDWSHAGSQLTNSLEVNSLDENNEKYCFAERLWIISSKNKH